MEDKFNSVARYTTKNQVGLIPASPRNPEIFYTKDGEGVAATVLLTFLMMKPEMVAHCVASRMRIVCSNVLGPECQQITQNLIDNTPVTQKCDVTPEDIWQYNQAIGLASRMDNIAQIFRQSINQKRNKTSKTAGNERLLAELFCESDDGPTIDTVSDEDNLYQEIEYGDPAPLPISLLDVIAAQDDQKQLIALMRKIQKEEVFAFSMKDIPRTLCHEIGHLSVPKKLIAQAEALRHFTDDDIIGFNPDGNVSIGMIEFARPLLAYQAFKKGTLKDEIAGARALGNVFGNDKMRRSAYFLNAPNSSEESEAELIGTALIQEMEDRWGVSIKKTSLYSLLENSYALIKRGLGAVQSPSHDMQSIFEDNPFFDPERQMMPKKEWPKEEFDFD